MKFLINIIVITLCINSFQIAFSQNTTGIVRYEGNINPVYVDSFLIALEKKKDVSMQVKQKVTQSYRNSDSDYFMLHFNDKESYYFYEEPMSTPEVYNVGSKSSKVPYYFKKTDDKIIKMSKYLGNSYREILDWNITKETKKIGNYISYKAIASERLYSRRGFYYSKQVIAWFTPQIPLNYGPSNYVGLPGLVLEVQRDKFSLHAIEINLNPEDSPKILGPKKNAKIKTQEEVNGMIDDAEADRKRKYGNN